jgi:glutathione S-transferase
MRIELYWLAGSCARVPYVALEEIGAPFELHVLNRFRGETETEAYRAVNPKLKVPVLVLEDWVITENPVIQSVLASRFPEAGLLPTGEERVEVEARSTMAWFASGLHPAVGRQRFPRNGSAEEAAWEGIRAKARADLAKGFAILEQRLEGREWLYGEWSILDAYMHWLWFRAVGSGMEASPFPRCADHGRRCEARPSVARVLDREEAEMARYEEEGVVPPELPPYQVGRLPAKLTQGAD